MQRALLGTALLALACDLAHASDYYLRMDTRTTPSAFVEYDGATAYSLSEAENNYSEQGFYGGFTRQDSSANLGTGRLAVFHDSNNQWGAASSTVYFGDTLNFNLGGLPYADVTVGMSFHGVFDPFVTQGAVQYGLRLGQVLLEGAFQGEDRVWLPEDGRVVSDSISFVVRVFPNDTDFAFWSYLNVNDSGYGTADFSNTAQMSIDVPDHVNFTSASGVFLTEVSAVPTPATVWLFGSGLGLMGLMRRKMSS